ncbi:MAG: GNAT family N-acetyltransferase [Burkholderiaceae bacterium]
MSIQRLQPQHAAIYRQLMLEAYALQPDAFTSSVAERAALPLSWWEARLDNAPQSAEVVLGAFADAQLVGVAGVRFASREKSRHKATLFGMYVRLPCRQTGLGKQLVKAAIACAKERPGVEIVQLTVSDGNRAAQTLYERCGFESFGVEPYAVTLDALDKVDKAYVAKVHMWHSLVPNLQSPNDFEHQIVAAEERLRLAMLASKVAVLDELISPQLLFTTHLGQLVNKKDDLAMHASGALKFHALEPHHRHIRIFDSGSASGAGAVALVSVHMYMSGIHSGVPFSADLLYTRVWQRGSNEAWQIIAGHSSAVQS